MFNSIISQKARQGHRRSRHPQSWSKECLNGSASTTIALYKKINQDISEHLRFLMLQSVSIHTTCQSISSSTYAWILKLKMVLLNFFFSPSLTHILVFFLFRYKKSLIRSADLKFILYLLVYTIWTLFSFFLNGVRAVRMKRRILKIVLLFIFMYLPTPSS